MFSHRGLSNLIEVVGADRIVLGSDYPADMGEPRPVDFIESHPELTEDQRRLILGGNMERRLVADGADRHHGVGEGVMDAYWVPGLANIGPTYSDRVESGIIGPCLCSRSPG